MRCEGIPQRGLEDGVLGQGDSVSLWRKASPSEKCVKVIAFSKKRKHSELD